MICGVYMFLRVVLPDDGLQTGRKHVAFLNLR